jgi:hypothetical protein
VPNVQASSTTICPHPRPGVASKSLARLCGKRSTKAACSDCPPTNQATRRTGCQHEKTTNPPIFNNSTRSGSTAHPYRRVVVVLPPNTTVVADGLWIHVLRIWLRLPLGIRPHIWIWYDIPSSTEVVTQTRGSSTQPCVPRPGCAGQRDGAVGATAVETCVSRPSRPSLSVVHVIVLRCADGNVDVRAFVLEYVFEPTPRRSIPTILWPYEDPGWLHVMESPAVLVPSSQARIVFCRSGSMREWHRIEEGDVVGRLHAVNETGI